MIAYTDHHPPRPVCEAPNCFKRSDIIMRNDRYLCATHALEEWHATRKGDTQKPLANA